VIEAWDAVVSCASGAFGRPSFALFADLASAWVLCPARRTLTGMIGLVDPSKPRAHDAYHRFVRAGAWSMAACWAAVAKLAVATLCPAGTVGLDVDDTLFHKSGRKVDGAGSFRDAVRSSGKRVVYATGLNLVVVTLRVVPPWGGEPLGLPVNVRLFRKAKLTHNELVIEMMAELAGWLPGRDFVLCGDGAYASLAGAGLARTHLVSRMRRDAALYEPPPPRTGRRGRPAKKGLRLPTPATLAATTKKGWVKADVDMRGRRVSRLLLARPVLWYRVSPERQVLLVVVRDPEGVEHDDFFFTTDLDAVPADVVSRYAGRWSIEDTFRAVKQSLGGQEPQSWKANGPERAAALSFWIYTAVWLWYIPNCGASPTWPKRPWYTAKTTPSFVDALASLRRVIWHQRVSPTSRPGPLTAEMTDTLIEALARAA